VSRDVLLTEVRGRPRSPASQLLARELLSYAWPA
jgi:hypothetical protein